MIVKSERCFLEQSHLLTYSTLTLEKGVVLGKGRGVMEKGHDAASSYIALDSPLLSINLPNFEVQNCDISGYYSSLPVF